MVYLFSHPFQWVNILYQGPGSAGEVDKIEPVTVWLPDSSSTSWGRHLTGCPGSVQHKVRTLVILMDFLWENKSLKDRQLPSLVTQNRMELLSVLDTQKHDKPELRAGGVVESHTSLRAFDVSRTAGPTKLIKYTEEELLMET